MRDKRARKRLATTFIAALLLAPIQPPYAMATTSRAVTDGFPISSASLIVFASTLQSYSNTRVRLSQDVQPGAASDFFVNNSGSISITGFALIITLPTDSVVSKFQRCDIGVKFKNPNVCESGLPTALPITPGSATTYVIPLPAGSFYNFQIQQSKSGAMQINTYANTARSVRSVTNS